MAKVLYYPNGTLDASFGTNGKIVAPINSGEELVGRDIALQPDGKIIAVGFKGGVGGGAAVNRYNSDGTLDASFGTGGKVVTPDTFVQSVTVQPDGKIVVVGSGSNGFAVIRYNPNGSLDSGFGEGGKIITSFSTGYAYALAVMLKPNGKIVVAGQLYGNGSYDQHFAFARYNANGSLDSGFGAGGKVVQTFPNAEAYLRDAVLQPDGRIVVAGFVLSPNPAVTAIVRYNANGSVDTSFAANGVFTSPNTFFSEGGITTQPDGKIVSFGGANGGFAALRLNPNGSPDTGFGLNGIATTNLGNSFGTAGAIQRNGRILLLGYKDGDVVIARFIGDSAVPQPARFDFDGDGRADISVFRPSDRVWYLNQSTNGFAAAQFGLSTDKITPADYDGDGKTDIAVYRDGFWYWLNSSNGNFNAIQFGQTNDIPQPADFSGDGRAELAVYRNGNWFMLNLTNNQFNAAQFGIATDKPVVADYDGDGRADYAVYRDGVWYLNRSTQGFAAIQFGISTDKLVPADYDADGKTDLAVYRDGTWYLLGSQTGFTAFQFGNASDVPAPADYDSDGKTDAAIYRNGTWYLRQSANEFSAVLFGLTNDIPVPSAFAP